MLDFVVKRKENEMTNSWTLLENWKKLWNMRIASIVVSAFQTIPKGIEELEMLRSARIFWSVGFFWYLEESWRTGINPSSNKNFIFNSMRTRKQKSKNDIHTYISIYRSLSLPIYIYIYIDIWGVYFLATHTHLYIYICVCVCVLVCVWTCVSVHN